jgi:hypothetical protein
MRILFQQSLDDGESLVILVRNRKNDFKVGVFLVECRFEVFEKIGVETFQRA